MKLKIQSQFEFQFDFNSKWMSSPKLFGKSDIDFQYKMKHNNALHNLAITHRLNALPFHILIPVTGFEIQILFNQAAF